MAIVYLLKHWNDLTNEHNDRLTLRQKLTNPHLEVNHNGIIYFNGIENFSINWKDVIDITKVEETEFSRADIVIETNTQFIKINGYYETISIYDIYNALCDYRFMIKNNRKQLKIT